MTSTENLLHATRKTLSVQTEGKIQSVELTKLKQTKLFPEQVGRE